MSSGLSDDHRRYLALGGKGFLLGDGRLRYGREPIVETYYTAQRHRGAFIAADLQLIARPGYDRDRGPITVGSLRLHLELQSQSSLWMNAEGGVLRFRKLWFWCMVLRGCWPTVSLSPRSTGSSG